jgi:chromosome segregation ATPase
MNLIERLEDIRLVTDPNSPLEPTNLRREAAQALREREAEIDALRSYLSKSEDTVEGLEAEIATAEINFARYQDTIKELRTENERIEREAACAAHNADQYHGIIREQRGRITQLEAVLDAAREYERLDAWVATSNYKIVNARLKLRKALATISPTEETP